jgi:hypothetical protein
MTASELKTLLRARHPATQHLGTATIPGPWTTIEEFMGIDLLAFSAHARPAQGGLPGVRYPRIGYEVKVSRGDLRRELLAPLKRKKNVEWCNAFYLATPKGLISKEELEFEEPEHFESLKSFSRSPCPAHCHKDTRKGSKTEGERIRFSRSKRHYVLCTACDGKGYLELSTAEKEAPTLWVPRDLGLVEVSESGCRVIKQAPIRKSVPPLVGQQLHDLVRWTSFRNDPRHRELRRQHRRKR